MDKIADTRRTQMDSHDKERMTKEAASDKKYPDYCRTMVIKGEDDILLSKISSRANT